MKHYITVDGGTTNTRVNLVENEKITATQKITRGARAGIDDRDGLKSELKIAISSILEENRLSEKDVIKILASGMITSEFGLYELPHLQAPVGIKELHDSVQEVAFPEISSIPFVFIRGIKCDSDSIGEFDMMRGEETELYGLTCTPPTNALYVLPGSHSKLIELDAHGRIAHFCTLMTGEMIAALAGGTILRDAVDLSVKEFDCDELLLGCRYSMEKGISEALFKVRIMKNQFGRTARATYSFFLGAVLAPEIQAILASRARLTVIGGKAQLKHATAHLLHCLSNKEISVIEDSAVDASSALGAIRIFEFQRFE